MGTENKSIYQKYKGGLILLIVLIITFLVLTIYQDKKDYLTKDDLRMYDLKAELDTIKANQRKLDSNVKLIDMKIDSTSLKISNSKSNITNIYKNEIYEKSELNKANDTVNLNFFNSYINQWIKSNTKIDEQLE